MEVFIDAQTGPLSFPEGDKALDITADQSHLSTLQKRGESGGRQSTRVGVRWKDGSIREAIIAGGSAGTLSLPRCQRQGSMVDGNDPAKFGESLLGICGKSAFL